MSNHVLTTNLFSHLRSARVARPNEKRLPVPARLVDTFLTEAVQAKHKADEQVTNLQADVLRLTRENDALKAEVDRLKGGDKG